jgi:protein-L-isoaspartate(D-aspartate) O-methyltransferase
MSVYIARLLLSLLAAAAAATGVSKVVPHTATSRTAQTAGAVAEDAAYLRARRQMVERDLRDRGISDPHVLAAMGRIPRECFIPTGRQADAYLDEPLQIGHDQTISRPYIVALMTQLARPSPEKRALEVGTGSGYQAAVLADVCREVDTIQIIPALAHSAQQRLLSLGYDNLHFRCGDGYHGWPQRAPFDIIIVAAAPDHVPQALVDELAPGGRLVIPVGDALQKLLLIEKNAEGHVRRREIVSVKFVPMTGEAQHAKRARLMTNAP